MSNKYTATVGEQSFPIDLKDWPAVAAQAEIDGRKAYLVVNADHRVIAEAYHA